MNDYQQRLEDIITIGKVTDFERINSKQMRELMAEYIICQMKPHEKPDLFCGFNEKQSNTIAGLLATALKGNDLNGRMAIEAMAFAWMADYQPDLERDFYAAVNEINANRSMSGHHRG
jgi:hypothetical protein